MKTRILRNAPLHPLAGPARSLSRQCDEIWIATAFVSDAALHDVVEIAVDAGADARFLTGTFGSVTRLRTFRRLARLAKQPSMAVRLWHGDFHAKVYLWRFGRDAVAWVGSANLTDRGLKSEGELLLELRGAWGSSPFTAIRAGFNAEWKRAEPIDDEFLSRYREAPRSGGLLGTSGRGKAPRRRARVSRVGAMIVMSVAHHYSDDSRVAKRVDALLGNDADTWYRAASSALKSVRQGHYCLVVDALDKTVVVGVVSDVMRDGAARVVAYERLGRPRSLKALKTRLTATGLRPTKLAFRTLWLDDEGASNALELVHGPRARREFERKRVQR